MRTPTTDGLARLKWHEYSVFFFFFVLVVPFTEEGMEASGADLPLSHKVRSAEWKQWRHPGRIRYAGKCSTQLNPPEKCHREEKENRGNTAKEWIAGSAVQCFTKAKTFEPCFVKLFPAVYTNQIKGSNQSRARASALPVVCCSV